MNFINTFFNGITQLFYPVVCISCGSDELTQDRILCLSCRMQVPHTGFNRYGDNPVNRLFAGRLPLNFATATLYFNKGSVVQRLLHELKYKNRKDVGMLLGKMMGDMIVDCPALASVDGMVPMPLHPSKQRSRGFNQAELLCEGIREVAKIDIIPDLVYKTSSSGSQTKKSRMERWQNSEGKFKVRNGSRINQQHILLVDDVVTTGATLEACGRTILAATDYRLSIITAAYTSL